MRKRKRMRKEGNRRRWRKKLVYTKLL